MIEMEFIYAFHSFLVNFALGRYARQLSQEGGFAASRSVDGDRTETDIFKGSCSSTNFETMAWWQVDLQRTIDVYAVTITSRDNAVIRVSDFEIRVGASSSVKLDDGVNCAGRLSLSLKETRSFFCFSSIRGRYVTVRSRISEKLQLCEVSVQGKEERALEPPGL